MTYASLVLLLTILPLTFDLAYADSWDDVANRYNLANVNEKRVNNRGDGFEPLYGTRNFRQVLRGVVYRGGANNMFHKANPRDNMNPLPDDGRRNLCLEGFSQSYYLYSENYDPSMADNFCSTQKSKTHQFTYLQRSPMRAENSKVILETVYNALKNPQVGPIYLHCWNGWHASGYISAIVLRQFCDFNATAAVEYWDLNTDGHNTEPQFEKIRNRIRNFVPHAEFKISSDIKRRICPWQ